LLMRTLFLIRHAKSSWDNPGLRDFNRPLNERGLRDAPRMAELLAGKGVRPDLIMSSPAKRALTTAQFFAAAFGLAEDSIVRQQAIYEASPLDILRIIGELPEAAHTVLLFGHNPTFTDVTNMLAEKSVDNVPTCGIVHIESDAPTWPELYEGNATLKGLYFPKEVI
jgi:phosphohistidine phosphatase